MGIPKQERIYPSGAESNKVQSGGDQRLESPSSAHAFHWQWMLLLVFVATGLRAYFSLSQDGLYWPDEIYQSLEPAHRLVFGYGLVAWEFIDGARNWAFPGIIAGVLRALSAFGIDHPRTYLTTLRLLLSLSGGLTCLGVYRLASAYRTHPLASFGGALLFGFSAVPIYFGHRAMTETASLPLIAFGLAWTLELDSTLTASRSLWFRAKPILGASLLGLSVLFRLQNAVFCAGLLIILLARRQWRRVAESAATLAAWAFFLGLVDRLTWGDWFHSALRYIQFNLVEGKASGWGTAEASYYVEHLWLSMPAVVFCTGVLFLLSLRRAPGLGFLALAFFLLHCTIPHKELRFILPVLPLFFASAGIGLGELQKLFSSKQALPWAFAVVAAVGLQSAWATRNLTFGDLGSYGLGRAHESAWDDAGSVNRLLLVAHDQPDICGLKIEPVHMAWTGGQSYFHRPVPLYSHVGPPRESSFYNYVITVRQLLGGTQPVAQDGPLFLARLSNRTCAVDANYSDRLP